MGQLAAFPAAVQRRPAPALLRDGLAAAGVLWLALVVAVAFAGPSLAPHPPLEMTRAGGAIARLLPPGPGHWLGTTDLGRDVLSQLLVGTRTEVVVGFIAALLTTAVGGLLGIVSGYYRGAVDNVIMRLVDVAYALPFEAVAIVFLSILTSSDWLIVLTIVMLFWRQPTRVVRNQVLSLRERSFVRVARSLGAGDARILGVHIAPNVLPIAFVYAPVAFGNAVIAQASINFLGFGSPDVISWGGMLRTAFSQGVIGTAWWWAIPPGLCITLTTAAVFFATRPFEEILNPRLRET